MTDTAPRLMSRADFARQLGMSVRTLENWERQKKGPRPVRIGRTVRYDAAEVEAYLYYVTNLGWTKAAS